MKTILCAHGHQYLLRERESNRDTKEGTVNGVSVSDHFGRGKTGFACIKGIHSPGLEQSSRIYLQL